LHVTPAHIYPDNAKTESVDMQESKAQSDLN
jgi:hypothetical protein